MSTKTSAAKATGSPVSSLIKLIVSSSVLADRLRAISFCNSKNPIVPILENVKIESADNKLVLTTSDLQNTAIIELPAETSGNCSTCIPFELLTKLLASMPEQPLTLVVDTNTHSLKISSESGDYEISGENPVDWPKLPQISSAQEIDILGDLIRQPLDELFPMVSTDDLRPAMTGVYLAFSDEAVTMVATNGHMLGRRVVEGNFPIRNNGSRSATMIIPSKAAKAIASQVKENPEAILTISFGVSQMKVAGLPNNMLIYSRLIDERYPDFENAIPNNNSNRLIVEKTALLAALNRVELFSNRTTHAIRFTMNNKGLRLSAEDLDYSNQARESVLAEYDGDYLEIGFSLKYFRIALSSWAAKQVRLDLSAPNRAGLLRPAEAQEGDPNVVLVMPIALNSY